MFKRPTLTLLVVLCVHASALGSLRVTPPSIPEADPGAYVTLPVRLTGSGEATISLTPTPGWRLVTSGSSRTLTDGEEQILFVTLQTPADAPPGPHSAVTVEVRDGTGAVVVATPQVRIREHTEVRWDTPPRMKAVLGETARVDTTLVNVGNVSVRVALEPTDRLWATSIDPTTVALLPGASTPVTVRIRPPDGTQAGFRYLWTIRARLDGAGSPISRSGIIEFEGRAPRHVAGRAPSLTFGVGVHADATISHGPGGTTADVGWTVVPDLQGKLSDYVDGHFDAGSWSGSVADPFAVVPRTLSANLWGDDWTLNVSAGSQSVALSAASTGGEVQFGGGLGYRALQGGPSYSAQGSVGTRFPGVQLDASAAWRASPTEHVESARVSAQTAINDDISATASVTAVGISGGGTAYTVVPGLAAGLRLHYPLLEISPRYQGYPTLGEHRLMLSAETSAPTPFRVRGYAQYDLHSRGPTTANFRSTISGTLKPMSGLTLQLTGGYASAAGTSPLASWSVSPRVIWHGLLGDGWKLASSLSYEHVEPITGDAVPSDSWQIDSSVEYGDVRGAVGAGHLYRGASSGASPLERFEVSADVSWDAGVDTTLSASYDLRSDTRPVDLTRHALGVAWDQAWPLGIDSKMSLVHRIEQLPAGNVSFPDSLTLGVRFPPLEPLGLSITAAYRLTAPYGVFAADAKFNHALRVGVGVRLGASFETPSGIVDVFGGRKIGRVDGRVFLDSDADGVFGPGDTPLVGVGVSLGDAQEVSDDEGRFRALVGPGRYEIRTIYGVPEGLGLPETPSIDVGRNARLSVDVALRPVANVIVIVFDDRDRDGVRDASEVGIPYARLLLEGPVRFEGTADAHGAVQFRSVPSGRYQLEPAAAGLPKGYSVTSKSHALHVEANAGPVHTSLGAALPPRQILTTFTSGDLSVFATPEQRAIPAGGEMKVVARTSGEASRVWAELEGNSVEFTHAGGTWVGYIPISEAAGTGLVTVTVFAQADGEPVTTSIHFQVTDGPLATARNIAAFVGESAAVLITTAYRASAVQLLLTDGTTLPLVTSDHRTWTGSVVLDVPAGRHELPIVVDGRTQGTLTALVEEPR